jgi:hypothetical protein
MNKGVDHPQLEMMVGFLPMDKMYLYATAMVDLSTLMVMVF